jgi:GrpB-like predicted nucleotidyltransferase (UPF0157 family)
VGSSAVPGLSAKPILDVVVGLVPGIDPDRVITALQPLGCQFRGDKGDEGGPLLVLEDRPAHRVAHLHLVGYGDAQSSQDAQPRGADTDLPDVLSRDRPRG